MNEWKNPDSVARMRILSDDKPHCSNCMHYRFDPSNIPCAIHEDLQFDVIPRSLDTGGAYCCWDFKWNQDNQP